MKMTAREQHLSEMVDRALDQVTRARAEAVKSRLLFETLVAIKDGIGRLEQRIMSLERTLQGARPEGQTHKPHGATDPAILAALENGPLTASDVAKVVHVDDNPTYSQRATMRVKLQRLFKAGLVTFDPFKKTYTRVGVADTRPAVIQMMTEGSDERDDEAQDLGSADAGAGAARQS